MIKVEDFKKMIIAGVEGNFKNDKKVDSFLFMAAHDGKISAMPIPTQSDQAKEVLTTMVIPTAIKKTGATMIATVNEAWMRVQNPTEKVNHSIPVRDHADKVEIVMVTIETKLSTEMLLWKIRRPEGADPYLEFDKETSNNTTQIGGRFANILGQKPSKN